MTKVNYRRNKKDLGAHDFRGMKANDGKKAQK